MGEDRVGPRTIVMMIVLFARYRRHFFSRILLKKKKSHLGGEGVGCCDILDIIYFFGDC